MIVINVVKQKSESVARVHCLADHTLKKHALMILTGEKEDLDGSS